MIPVALLCSTALMGTFLPYTGPVPAHADDWTGTVSNDWFDSGNWLDGSVPISLENVNIDTVATNPTVIDGGSAFADRLQVGEFGTGNLAITNNGTVSSQSGTLGLETGAQGTVTVTGASSAWNIEGNLFVGQAGTGTLGITAGGKVVTGNLSVLGHSAGSAGTATVIGPDSVWTLADSLQIGRQGTGELVIADGGVVSLNPSSSGAAYLNIGSQQGGTGVMTVTGAGSTWTDRDGIIVADHGTGRLMIEAGGLVTSSLGIFGNSADGAGTAIVRGIGSQWNSSDFLWVGRAGSGELTVEAGGSVSGTDGVLGVETGSRGTAMVTGAYSTWRNSNTLTVGSYGTGTLTVADGGVISATQMTIADRSGSVGTLNIGAATSDPAATGGTLDIASVTFGEGTGIINFNHSGTDYEFAPVIGGNGSVNQLAGITNLTGISTYTGVTHVNGGTLLVEGMLGDTTTTVSTGAALGGSGAIDGDVTVQDGGMLAPGSSVGTFTLGSLALSSGSILDFELGLPGVIGGNVNDLIEVTGSLTLDGTLNITNIGGFGTGVYRLMNYSGDFIDNTLDFGTLPAGVTAADLLVQTSVANQVNLISTVGTVLQFWDGDAADNAGNGTVDGGNGIWTAADATWTQADGALNGAMKPKPGFAIFQGEAGTVTADAGAGALTVTGMQFASDGYRIEGDPIALTETGGQSILRVGDGTTTGAATTATIASAVTGAVSLIKTDLGTLILSGENSYQGGTVIQDGTLQITTDANLGASTGSVTLTGGTLRTAADIDSHRLITLAGTGGFEVATGTTFGLSGSVTGSGDLVKAGEGSLSLLGANSYQGNTLVSAGTLTGTTGSIRGTIGNAGTVVFDQKNDASFVGKIGGLNGINGTMTKQGAGTLVLGGMSTLDWAINMGRLTTAAERFIGSMAIGADGNVTFDQTADAQYAGTLTGTGGFIKTGAGALTYTGNSAAFAGPTIVDAGTLVVNGTLGGTLSVLTGSRLRGSGTIGTTMVASGAAIAPGNSIGTLTIDGDVTFAAGSTYEVEINPALKSDLIHASGAAMIRGGTVHALKVGGVYTPGSRWTVVGADGGITGRFDELTQNMPFVDLALAYDANNIYIDATRNQVAFCDVARTNNQCATGGGLESAGTGNPVYDAVAALADDGGARQALDSLSGEIHASAKTALIEDSHFVRDAVHDRIRAAFGDSVGTDMPMLAYGPDGTRLPSAGNIDAVVWGLAFGAWSNTDHDSNAAKLDHSTGGFLTGIDGAVTSNIRLGLLAGYSHSSFEVDDRSSSGSSDNYHLGIYGGGQWDAFRLSGGIAYTWHDIETNRSVYFPGFADGLSADYHAGIFQAFGEAGYRISMGSVSFEPFANLAYVSLHTDGFPEDGGMAALKASNQTTETSFTTFGARASVHFNLGEMLATAHGTLGWRHAFGDTAPGSAQAFAGGNAFTVSGVPIAEDSAFIRTGLNLDISDSAAVGVSYQGQIASHAEEHGFNAKFNLKF